MEDATLCEEGIELTTLCSSLFLSLMFLTAFSSLRTIALILVLFLES